MKALIGTIVAGVILAVFGWWLNQERYDVRYTLSEKIPLSFQTPQQQSIQQLEVRNLSAKPVEAVQVKLPPTITEHELVKYSQADTAKIFRTANEFELVYNLLPPGGTFRLVIKTTADGISKSQVQVRHSKGKADEALSEGSLFHSINFWSGVVVWLVYGCIVLFWLRSLGFDSWKSNAEYKSDKVLNASKPIYIPADKWKEIRQTAIEQFGRLSEHGQLSESEITGSRLYKYLDGEKPDSLSNDEWQLFCQAKTAQLLATIYRRINESWTKADEFLKILRIKRPLHFPADKWDEQRKKLQDEFCRRKLHDSFNRNILENILEPKPDGIDSQHWAEYQEKLTAMRFKDLSTQMELQESPIDFLTRQNLAGLNSDDVQRLRTRAYKLQLAALPALHDERAAKQFLEDEKPTWMNSDDYTTLRTAAEQLLKVAEQEKNNSIEREKILKDSVELAELKTKVSNQLNILGKLFSDPAAIDRIEPYDNPFTTGNLELLKNVAKALRVRGS